MCAFNLAKVRMLGKIEVILERFVVTILLIPEDLCNLFCVLLKDSGKQFFILQINLKMIYQRLLDVIIGLKIE